jgi:hypothetical protein
VLTSRKSPELVHSLDVIVDEFNRTAGNAVCFRRMLCDQDFRKSPQVVEWTKSKGIEMRDVATEGHSQNGSIETANRVLRMFFERLFLANGSDDGLIEAMITASTRSKNACIGNKAASAEEIWTGSVPKLLMICWVLTPMCFCRLNPSRHLRRERLVLPWLKR